MDENEKAKETVDVILGSVAENPIEDDLDAYFALASEIAKAEIAAEPAKLTGRTGRLSLHASGRIR